MSVIDLNLWIKYQVLKTTCQQIRTQLAASLDLFRKQMITAHQTLIYKLLSEIRNRDQIISQLRRKEGELGQNKCDGDGDKENKCNLCCGMRYKKAIKDLEKKYQQALQQNKQYQIEFKALLNEMEAIKMYVEELKKARDMKSNVNQQTAPPAKKLQFQEENQILHKITSLSQLRAQISKKFLDTIKEVTEISLHSQSDEEQELHRPKQKQFKKTHFAGGQKAKMEINLNTLIQSRSFECKNEIQDITKFLAHQSDISHQKTDGESFEYSLGILKNYCSTADVTVIEQSKKFQLPSLKQLQMPLLQLKNYVNYKYLVFQDGYIYTGNTMKKGQQNYIPMGFGQLFQNHQLVYCGQWKNGSFSGWGKMYLDKRYHIKSFNGKWQQGFPEGPGTIKYWNDSKFIGTLRKGRIEGEGALYKDGEKIYQGYWKENNLVKSQF